MTVKTEMSIFSLFRDFLEFVRSSLITFDKRVEKKIEEEEQKSGIGAIWIAHS